MAGKGAKGGRKGSGPKDGKAERGRNPRGSAGDGGKSDSGAQDAVGTASKDSGEDRRPVGPALRLDPPTRDPIPDGPPQPKAKRGAPSKADKAERERVATQELVAQREMDAKSLVPYVGPLLAWPFEAMADKRGEHWRLQDKKRDELSFAALCVLLKYLPGFLLMYKEELMLLVVVGTIVAPRVAKDKELAADRSRKLRGDGDSGQRKDDTRKEAGRNPLAG